MFLVTGATGNIGGKVLAELHAKGHKVRALTRDPAKAELPEGVEVVAGDMGRPASLRPALDGVERVFLMSLGSDKSTHDGNLVAEARAAGVEHIVQLSTLGVEVEGGGENPLGHWHHIAERALQESGVSWTILRPNGFMSMTLGWAASLRSEGVARGPLDNVPEAIVDPRDVAAVAVRALTEPGHEGRTYRLTGPAALTAPEQVRIIGSLLGREVRFERVSLEDQREMLARHFGEETAAGVVATLKDAIENGSELHGRLFPDAGRLLGREPRSFREWAEDHLGLFAG